jgi:hypothetical protein
MPIYKRPQITQMAVKCLQNQTVPFYKIILIGSSKSDEVVARKCGVEYIQYSNEYLSRKYQAGVFFSQKFNPYAVMSANSDDLISPTWNETFLRESEGYDLLGADKLIVLDYSDRKMKQLYSLMYWTSKSFFGPGKWFTRRYLDKAKWEVYNITKPHGCDGGAHAIAESLGAKMKALDGTILSVKGDWDMIDSLEHLKTDRSVNMKIITHTRRYLRCHFPESLKLLDCLSRK